MKEELIRFIKQAPLGYLLLTSLILLGAAFGLFEIFERTILTETPERTMRWLYLSRGILSSLMLMIWAAWTVYNYRELYEEKLEATEERYKNIIENSADAILTFDDDYIIRSWNSGAEDVLGWKREEIIGRPIQTIIPDDLLKNQELECIEQGMQYRGFVRNYETERLHKDGNLVMVNLTESFIRNEDDEIIGRSQILRDLSELKMREEQVRHSERLAAVGHMAAGVAHEIGNPLTAISSLAQLSQRKTDEPLTRELTGKIRDHIQRIDKIVRDLVDFSRPSSLESELTQVNEIIESAVGLLQHDARCRDVEFDLKLADNLPRVRCVPDHLHQVFVNLFLNAVDAMKENDEPRITVKTDRVGSQVHVEVTDRGMGIKEQYQSRIFE
ncbi:MAG: PAS domain S-box protein, partial [Balneolaceae bacterium]|nr:PAS domain S-box protein [Balneolaceae bacterium]